MAVLRSLTERRLTPLLVVFVDVSAFQRTALGRPDLDIAASLDALYRLVEQHIGAAGGIVLKFIGDAALIVFEEADVDSGVRAVLSLKEVVDAWLPGNGWPSSQLIVKAHFGEVVAGPYGGEARLDVIGNVVNTTATLQARPFALSPQAFRRLAPDTRKLFKKHTPPTSYIRATDRHQG